MRHAAFIVAVLITAAPWHAWAQECPTGDADCAAGGPCPLRDFPYEQFIAAPPTDRGGREIPPVAERPFDPEAGDRILVRGFTVEGVRPNPAAGITQESVQSAADAAFAQQTEGKGETRMTVGHMVRVADAVTTFYRSKGYLVAKAFLPVQTVGPESVVKIQVIEGKVAEVVVEGAKGYSPDVLRKPSVPLIGSTPTRDEVEAALLYTQDYPGVRLFGTFRPGAELGETRLVLQVLEEDSFGFQAGADNYGSEFTGEYRARLDAAWKNPFGRGGELSASILQSAAPENTTFGALAYRVPVGPRGLGAYADLSRNAFAVDEEPFDELKIEGLIDAYEIGADWRYVRGRFSNWRTAMSYISIHSELTGLGTLQISDDQYSVAEFETGIDRVDLRFRGVDQIGSTIRYGLGGEFKSSSGLEENFLIVEARYTRVQALADTQTAVFRLRAQSADRPISPLEQFGLAGPDAVRAYPVGQVLRDNGQFLSLEYQVQAPGFARAQGPFGRAWGDLLQFGLFADYARGVSAEGADDEDLSGAGASVRFGVPGSFQFLLEGARPLSSREANDGKDLRFYGSLSVKF